MAVSNWQWRPVRGVASYLSQTDYGKTSKAGRSTGKKVSARPDPRHAQTCGAACSHRSKAFHVILVRTEACRLPGPWCSKYVRQTKYVRLRAAITWRPTRGGFEAVRRAVYPSLPTVGVSRRERPMGGKDQAPHPDPTRHGLCRGRVGTSRALPVKCPAPRRGRTRRNAPKGKDKGRHDHGRVSVGYVGSSSADPAKAVQAALDRKMLVGHHGPKGHEDEHGHGPLSVEYVGSSSADPAKAVQAALDRRMLVGHHGPKGHEDEHDHDAEGFASQGFVCVGAKTHRRV